MRVFRHLMPSLFAFCCCAAPLVAQNTTSTPEPITVLQNSLRALVGNTAVNDVTLTGTAERIAGSDDETGTVTYKAVVGCSRLDLNLSQGTRSEVRGIGANGPGGTWIGPDGLAHEISNHNLLTDAGWFPIFTLANLISSANNVLVYMGTETKNGVSVIQIRASEQMPNATAATGALWQHLTQLDIYLDASTFLPVALDFNTHPDNNAALDIPVEIRFSDYRSVGSASIPFHVQQFLNGSLFLDVQFQTASVNSGLSSSSTIFAIQ
jgi:hypothetical protein